MKETPTRRVIIAGAGLAGLATAVALRQAGLEVVVYEAYPDPTAGGASFLTVAANGMAALGEISCRDRVLAAGFLAPTIKVWTGNGKLLGRLPFAGSEYSEHGGLTVKRGDLVAVLMEEAQRRGAKIETGKTLIQANNHSKEVVVSFADGSDDSAEILIGADGIHSRMRQIIDADAPPPHYAGLIGTGGYADADMDAGIAPGEFNMVFGKRGFFGYVRHPDGPTWWYANLPRAVEPSRQDLDAMDPGQWRQHVEDAYEGDATPALRLIRATEARLRPHADYLMPPVGTWSRGHSILIGDAAHCASPSSGQGASMAFEDAIAIAKCLRDIPEVPGAFARYEALRRARVERIVKHGERGSRSKTFGPVALRLSELFMPVTFRLLAHAKWMSWEYTYSLPWNTPAA